MGEDADALEEDAGVLVALGSGGFRRDAVRGAFVAGGFELDAEFAAPASRSEELIESLTLPVLAQRGGGPGGRSYARGGVGRPIALP